MMNAFETQYAAEQAVWASIGRTKTRAEHAAMLLRRPNLLAPSIRDEVLDGAVEAVGAAAPSRWVHINKDRPSETAYFACMGCGTLSKFPGECSQGCTDAGVLRRGADAASRRVKHATENYRRRVGG